MVCALLMMCLLGNCELLTDAYVPLKALCSLVDVSFATVEWLWLYKQAKFNDKKC